MSNTDGLSLLDEFSAGLDTAQGSPALVKMANAKWQSELISAVASLDDHEIAQVGETFESLGQELLERLGQDTQDPRLLNVALQSLVRPATRELEQTGALTGQWLPKYAAAMGQVPALVRITSNSLSASTSMGMTLAHHHSELLALTDEFSFLRPPEQIATWAHEQIDTHAHAMAKIIAPHDETGPAYQNQLNCHRRLFASCYRAESRQWQSMLDAAPETASLYASGLPLNGVEDRFAEQAQRLSQLMNNENTPTRTASHSR